MNVSLTPELENWVKEKVNTGRYTSASEVVREAIRTLREQDEIREIQREKLRQQLTIGIEQLENGQSQPLTKDLLDSIKNKGRKSNR